MGSVIVRLTGQRAAISSSRRLPLALEAGQNVWCTMRNMPDVTSAPRQLTKSDLTWVVDLASARRERIVPFAPRFWKPAPNARELHSAFLSSLIDSPDVISIRTDQGFLFGMPRNDRVFVDDMALEDDSDWPTDGQALLRRAGETGRLRFVCPVPERARTSTASAVGLANVESWWHRDLEPAADRVPEVDDPVLIVDEAKGRLLPVPPVYAPGGLVLLVTQVTSPDSLMRIEHEAARRGACVSVVTHQPGDEQLAELLTTAGYKRTTDYYEGTPSAWATALQQRGPDQAPPLRR